MIPEAWLPAVTRAVRGAFNVETFDDVRPVGGGLSSALVYRLVVGGRPYLLRLVVREEPRDGPAREFACMQRAAEAGLAPRVHYADAADRTLIADFVEAEPLPADMAGRMARAIRRLQTLPDFPKTWDYLEAVDGFVKRFAGADLVGPGTVDAVVAMYARITAVYPRDRGDEVACHNDLKPENTLFDGTDIWIVDWEASSRNDPYVDLAIAANFYVSGEAKEQAYLTAFFGEPPGLWRTARFYLVRQITHVAYATLLSMLAARQGAAVDRAAALPDFDAFHRRLAARQVDMAQAGTRMQYALLHLDRALANAASPRFEQALAQMAGA